jgi:hypothetical protein
VLQFVSFIQSTLWQVVDLSCSFSLCVTVRKFHTLHTETSDVVVTRFIMSVSQFFIIISLHTVTSNRLVIPFIIFVSEFLCFIHFAQRQLMYSSPSSLCLRHSSQVPYMAHCDKWWAPCPVYYKYLWMNLFILTRWTF